MNQKQLTRVIARIQKLITMADRHRYSGMTERNVNWAYEFDKLRLDIIEAYDYESWCCIAQQLDINHDCNGGDLIA